MNESILTNNGWIVADVAVLIIALIAAIGSMLTMTGKPVTLKRAGAWTMSTGWMLITWRVGHQVVEGVDPNITTMGQMALALIGAGTIFYLIGDKWK